jgi:hypothetical protein
MPDEKIDQKRPVQAESELKKMQQRLVDDTVDDSFPASDPPAWTTAGSKSVAARAETENTAPRREELRSGSRAPRSARDLADRASRLARDAVRTGERYLNEARDRWPEAERYYDQGRRAVARPVEAYPVTAVLLAVVAGYGLAWLVHGRGSSRRSQRQGLPAYGRRPRIEERDANSAPGEPMHARGNLAMARAEAMAASSAPSSY